MPQKGLGPVMKCPKCGSKNVAKIQYGMPIFSEKLKSEIESRKVFLGGCCVTGTDPKYHCNDCGKEFGTPPDLICHGLPQLEIGYIRFSDGGFLGDRQEITLEKNENRAVFTVFGWGRIEKHSGQISLEEWDKILDKLFCRLYVHEWEKEYIDPNVLDGEQWELQFKTIHGVELNYYGSNAFPPMWKELKNIFKPYFMESVSSKSQLKH